MVSLGTLKRGDTFSFTADIVDNVSHLPLSGIAKNLTCHGKYTGYDTVLVNMVITETTTPGTYLFFVSSEETKLWRANTNVLFDIEYAVATDPVSSTDTLSLYVMEDITRE